MAVAIEDFARQLPEGSVLLDRVIREALLKVYSAAADGAEYFLDKTPRYHLIVDDLFRLFPDGRFIFLWRNPLAIAASIINTWGDGHWNLHYYNVDLFRGLSNLTRAYGDARQSSIAVNYEDLVGDPTGTIQSVFRYLDVDDPKDLFDGFTNRHLRGRMGDQSVVESDRPFHRDSLDKWRDIVSNPFRKIWFRRYLSWIGAERMMLMGYSLETAVEELSILKTGSRESFSDVARFAYSLPYSAMKSRLLRDDYPAFPPRPTAAGRNLRRG